MDAKTTLVPSEDCGFRGLLRQLRTGVPSIQLIRLGEFTYINVAVYLSLTVLIVLFIASQVSIPSLYVWAAAQFFFMFSLLRYLQGRKRHGIPAPYLSQLSPIGIPVVMAAIAGGLWGSLTAFIPEVPQHLQITLILVMLGVSGGGSVTLAPVQQSAIAFVLGCVLPVAIYHLTLASKTGVMLALMMVVYAAAMIGTSRVLNRVLLRQVKAEEQARELQEANLHQRIANSVNISETVNDAFRFCLEEVCRYTGWPVAHVKVAANDGTGEFISSGVIHAEDPERYSELRDLTLNERTRKGVGMTGYVLEIGQPFWSAAGNAENGLRFTFDNSIENPSSLRAKAALHAGLKSYLGFPVIIGQECVAILEFSSLGTARPTPSLMNLLVTIANELGRAIERRNSQLELQLSEQRFRILIESSAQGIAVHRDGKVIYVNEVGAQNFGYTVEEFLALNSILDVVHPAYRDRLAMLAQARLSGEKASRNFEFEGVHKDGHFVTLQARSSAIEWKGTAAVVTTTVDVSRQKKAEQVARREERRAKDYLNIAGSIIFAMDKCGGMTLLNRTGCDLLECEAQDVVGKNGFDLFVPKRNREEARADYNLRMNGKGDFSKAFVGRLMTTKGHVRDVLWRLAPLKDEMGNLIGVLGSGQDMTEQLRIEAQLQQAQKMEAVGQLTSGIAHDFNNILMVVMGNLEMAIELGGDDKDFLSAALRSAQRGADLNRQLLTFSKQQIVDTKTVDINEIIRGMSGLLRRTLGEDIKIRNELYGEECFSRLDPAQLESAILNLALNARDATPKGGELFLETGIANSDRFPETRQFGSQIVYILIRDTGRGMSANTRDRAIEPFFTTKKVGSGSGLGLSMVFNFARNSGGSMKIVSRRGKGTSVYIFLPRVEREERSVEESGKAISRRPKVNRRVLVVEDQIEVSKTIHQFLVSLGYQVSASIDGTDALRKIEAQSGDIDIVLSDVVLPGSVNGIEVVEFVNKTYPDIKTVLMSGNAEKSDGSDRNELPDVPFLRKPFILSQLDQVLTEAFATHDLAEPV